MTNQGDKIRVLGEMSTLVLAALGLAIEYKESIGLKPEEEALFFSYMEENKSILLMDAI